MHVDLVVVGAGITGLTAAWEAHCQGASVVVLEAGDRPGGKLQTSQVAGFAVDESADAFLARRPEAMDLCAELGLDTELVAPATGRAYVWVDGQLRPLPESQLLGVPTDLGAVASTGILTPAGVARAREDLRRDGARSGGSLGDDRRGSDSGGFTDRPDSGSGHDEPHGVGDRPDDSDEAVGALIRRRLGDEVLDRLVAPLVGGIWAGDCDRLSLFTATPALAEARQRDSSLIRGAAQVRAAATAAHTADLAAEGDPGDRSGSILGPEPVQKRAISAPRIHESAERPVFLAPRGGMGRLVDALVAALGDRVRTGQPVERIMPLPPGSSGRWRVEPAGLSANAVVVATPAFAAAPLVAGHCRSAAEALAAIDYASVALVTLAVSRDGVDHPLDGSGFLAPPSLGRTVTACSWASSKWEHLAGDGTTVLLRASVGRDGAEQALRLPDEQLMQLLLADLHDMMGLRTDPVDVRITRFAKSLPQPRPGHLDRVASLEADLAAVAPGLAVAGAWARGVGIPACIQSGRTAADAVLT